MAATQKAIFLEGEGDCYFDRNATKVFDPSLDPIIRTLVEFGAKPKRILEVGCGTADRLAALETMFAGDCLGIEPSRKAVSHAKTKYPSVRVHVGTAEQLPFQNNEFDLLIYGFCLYLCDPSDHFAIVCSADRVLKDKGLIAIFDFLPRQPFKNPYSHRPGLFSYKMCWSRMFSAHPSYRLLSRRYLEHGNARTFEADQMLAVDLLRKDTSSAFPLNP
jgi:ubiquinone/menaquinone biosynthesis C-methylase UbiE